MITTLEAKTINAIAAKYNVSKSEATAILAAYIEETR